MLSIFLSRFLESLGVGSQWWRYGCRYHPSIVRWHEVWQCFIGVPPPPLRVRLASGSGYLVVFFRSSGFLFCSYWYYFSEYLFLCFCLRSDFSFVVLSFVVSGSSDVSGLQTCIYRVYDTQSMICAYVVPFVSSAMTWHRIVVYLVCFLAVLSLSARRLPCQCRFLLFILER